MSGSKAPTLETPHQLQIPRSSRDRAHHHPPGLASHSRAARGCSVSPGRWVCTAALRGERRCQQPPVAGALAPLPPVRQHGGKEGSPDAQRAPLVCTEPWTSIWDQKSWQCQEPPVPQPRVLLCWRHEEPRPGWRVVMGGEHHSDCGMGCPTVPVPALWRAGPPWKGCAHACHAVAEERKSH